MRLAACLGNDIRLQFRSGFYLAYLVVSLLYSSLLRVLSPSVGAQLAPLVLYSDPSVLGLFFIGGLILLEHNDNTLQSLFATPLRVKEYILAKAIALGLLSLISSVLISVAYRGLNLNWLCLFLGVSLTTFMFTMIGIAIAASVDTVNRYMMEAIPYMLPILLPLLDHFGLWRGPWFWLIPTHSSLMLIRGTFEEITEAQFAISVAILTLCCFFSYRWAMTAFARRTARQPASGLI